MGQTSSKISKTFGDLTPNSVKTLNSFLSGSVDAGAQAGAWSLKMLGRGLNNSTVRKVLEAAGKPIEKAVALNTTYSNWKVKQASKIPDFGVTSTVTRGVAELSNMVDEHIRGLMPRSVYDRAEAPMREAKQVLDSIDAKPVPDALAQTSNGDGIDAAKVASRLNSMIYDPAWVQSGGERSTEGGWDSLSPSSEPWFYTTKSIMGGDDNVVGIWEQEGVRYVTFRGSISAENWLHNAQFNPTDLGGGVQVHSGTWTQWQSMRGEIFEQLRQPFDGPTVFTGHSLGGMLAHVAAYDAQAQGVVEPNVVSFGSPPVFNEAGASILNETTGFDVRYENQDDAVPALLSSTYTKSGTQIALASPLHSVNMLQHQVPFLPSGESELSAAATGDPTFAKLMDIGSVALQYGGWKLERHSPHNYATLYDYHSAGPYTKLAIMEQSVDLYASKMVDELTSQLEGVAGAAATKAILEAKAAQVESLMTTVREVMTSVATQIGISEELLAAEGVIYSNVQRFYSGAATAAEIAQPILIFEAVEGMLEAGMTLDNAEKANEMISKALEEQRNSEEFANAVHVISEEFASNDAFGTLLQLASTDPQDLIFYDSANPANVFAGAITDPGYLEWASTVKGDEQLGSPSATMDMIYVELQQNMQSMSQEQKPTLVREPNQDLPMAEDFRNENELMDRHDLEALLFEASLEAQVARLDTNFVNNDAGHVVEVFFKDTRVLPGT